MKSVSGPEPATRRSDALANQARVLDAAREVFAEQGVSAEIKDIAERAGVGVATIYRGFGSKKELLLATIDRASGSVSDLITGAEQADDPVVGLRLLVSGLLDYAESYGWLIQASIADPEIDRLRFSLPQQDVNRQRAARVIERAMQCGAVSCGVSLEVLRLLIEGSVLALAVRTRRHTPRPSATEIADGLVSLLTGSQPAGASP